MHGLRHSILKRWHSLTTTPARAAATWQSPWWEEEREGLHDIACHRCRKFDPARQDCSVPFGTPLRKCVVAAIEAHFHDLGREEVLEIGFGRFALARNLVRRGGGRWTGIDPAQPPHRIPALGRGGYGQAAAIPFPDATFDRVYGIQTFEHWGQRAAGRTPSEYSDCMAEIRRVLKPGGRVYLDAPIHFHGHEMFIMGDLERIRSVFERDRWDEIVIERWRHDHEPLPAYPPTARIQQEWATEIVSYPSAEIERVRDNASIWLLTIAARKLY
jgi:SAM-dependent methyltransferase